MSRNQLKNYAPKARQDFIRAVSDQAKKVGITGDDQFEPMDEQGDIVVIGGQPFSRKVAAQRRSLENLIRLHGFQQTMEEVAYTWFNRFAAIRYMELHGYLDHGYRVLSHPDGKSDPEILEHAQHVDLSGLNKDTVVELKLDGTKDEQLYRMLLVAQCNALNTSMPFLFERIDDQTELLLPDNLLHTNSVIRSMVSEIDESDWQEIEIIGWLYQFYISEKKDQVIGKVVKSEDIPAATQLFTPNWIVKYMVQNSLGHQWMATYPNSPLKEEMDYYIEPAEQTEEVQKQLAEITPTALNPEEITLLDPACGSGHILVEAYDLFKAIYEERGYQRRDIPKLILEKNLFGLDIDDRAAQLAGLALLMKARADDRLILSHSTHVNVMAIQSSEGLDAADISKHLLDSDAASEVKVKTIESLINLFEDAKTFGSLITMPENIRQALPALGQLIDQPSSGLPVEQRIREQTVGELGPLLVQANMLGQQYDCVVANPPYMGSGGMNGSLKSFAKVQYPKSKTDLYGIFMERAFKFLGTNGFNAQVNMQSWMFISSFESFRTWLLMNKTIYSMAHLGARAFGSISGEVVQTTAWIMRNDKCASYQPTFFRLLEGDEEKKSNSLKSGQHRYDSVQQSDFFIIPGKPLAYWASDSQKALFKNDAIEKFAVFKEGLTTANNDLFLRNWSEVDFSKITIGASKSAPSMSWVPYNKGGSYRKWYGNQIYVVDWRQNGERIKNYPGSSFRNKDYHFKRGATFSALASGLFSVRYSGVGFAFDSKGTMLFSDKYLEKVATYLNSKVCAGLLQLVSPTLDYRFGTIQRLPLLDVSADNFEKLVHLSKSDWDSFETSWDFKTFPFLSRKLKKSSTEESFSSWQNLCFANIQTMKELEEENNSLFIDAYGLHDELTPDVPEEQIALARADIDEDIKQLISYAIGCMMGRYSLAEEGLIFANSGNEGFDPTRYGDFPADDDGIVPITDTEWFDDDATIRFEEFLRIAWSPETLKENLKFIGDSLANNGGNDPLKTIRNYLCKGFYKDHLKTYKKRPIYWLFSSGKLKAFECLVYLHRYDEGTIARMRVDYVTPLQNKITARIDQLDDDIVSAPSTAARKKFEKEHDKLQKQKAELIEFDDKLRHYADQRISLDLDDGVKVNYGKFGDLLAEVKAVTGRK